MTKTTPKGDYTGCIVIDPLTRIEGHLRMEIHVENGYVSDARSCGTLFRGIENILIGRDPQDAQHFTQRTCGVCTYTHSLCTTRALEDAIGIEIPKNATLIRNLVLGIQYLHDHLVHFYHLHGLDFIDIASVIDADVQKTAKLAASISDHPFSEIDFEETKTKIQGLIDSKQLGPFANAYSAGGHPAYYLAPEANLLVATHYLKALRLQVKTAQAMAIFGAKNPHTQFLIAGGVTCYESLKTESLEAFYDLYKETSNFINHILIPDIILVSSEYRDWTQYGGGSNLLTFGEFPVAGKERDLESRWLKPGYILNKDLSKVYTFEPDKIAEHIRHSWYKGEEIRAPFDGVTEPAFTKMGDLDRYSWMKSPRYDNTVMETGPLAQILVSYAQGHTEVTRNMEFMLNKLNMTTDDLFSTIGRTVARAVECLTISQEIDVWYKDLVSNLASGDIQICEDVTIPDNAQGVGYLTAPRGGLSHWMRIENGVIANFQLVVPSTWNFGPRDNQGRRGPVEAALIGTPVADPKRPVEILRNVHAFDPCIACSVHVIDNATNEGRDFRIL